MKKNLISILKFTVIFITALASFDIYLRFTEISSPSMVIDDYKLGNVLKPNNNIMIIKEGFYMGKINSYGFLGPDYSPWRKNGTLRIAVIGDSYVEGFQLFEKYHFRSVLEEKLTLLTSQKVEVLNFGRSGFDLQRMYIYYLEKVEEFKPDITLFFLSPSDFEVYVVSEGPDCYIDKDNLLKINYDFVNSKEFKLKLKYRFVRELSIYSLAQNCFTLIKKGKTSSILMNKINFLEQKEPVTQEGFDKKLLNSRDINCEIIAELTKKSQNYLNSVIIVEEAKIPDDYEVIFKDLKIIPLYKELEMYKKAGVQLNYWKATNQNGHWNHIAHQIVGKYLANEIFTLLKKQNFFKN